MTSLRKLSLKLGALEHDSFAKSLRAQAEGREQLSGEYLNAGLAYQVARKLLDEELLREELEEVRHA